MRSDFEASNGLCRLVSVRWTLMHSYWWQNGRPPRKLHKLVISLNLFHVS